MESFSLKKIKELQSEGWLKTQTDGQLTVACYTQLAQYEKHWDEYTLNLRGHVLDGAGKVVGKTLSKFFNLNETEETKIPNLPKESYEVFQKADGTLLNIWKHGGEWRYSTKCSFDNEYIDKAKEFLPPKSIKGDRWSDYSHLNMVCELRIPNDPMRRVTNMEDGIYLITAYDRVAGTELDWQPVKELAQNLRIKTVKKYEATQLNELLETFHAEKDTEGYVIRFDSGLRVKLKTSWYLLINKILDNIQTPERTKEFIVEFLKNYDNDSDWLVNFPIEIRPELEELALYMRKTLADRAAWTEKFYEKYGSLTRKDYAALALKEDNFHLLFLRYDNKDYKQELIKTL